MKKKNVLLTTMVAVFALGVAMSFVSCNKAKTEGDAIPVVTEVMRGPDDWVLCQHCLDTLRDFNFKVIDTHPYDWDHFHQHFYGPDYIVKNCPITNCFWNGRNHVHEVYFWIDGIGHHYEDDWIHLGGGTNP